jgi:hypothetical protein
LGWVRHSHTSSGAAAIWIDFSNVAMLYSLHLLVELSDMPMSKTLRTLAPFPAAAFSLSSDD